MMKVHHEIKYCLVMLLLCLFSLGSSAQGQRVTIHLKNASLRQVFSSIERQTTYRFSYRNVVVDDRSDIDVNATSASVSVVLDAALRGRNLTYSIVSSKSIVISDKGAETLQPSERREKQTVTGTVLDLKGEPVVGATIMEKGTSNGTVTDLDGNFMLQNVSPSATLAISFLGYKTVDVSIVGKAVVHVTMTEDVSTLDEVVAIGYGTQKKVNLTGAVASVDAQKLASRPSTNVLSTLQGAVSGVTVISRPGSTSLNIRGRGNLGASEPLYIVDGVEVTSGFFNAMDPNNIETVSFLKDASSAAIYGAKAAYGVVLVTTKSGKAGQLRISYNGLVGSQSPTYLPKTVNSVQYAEMY